MSRRSQTYPSAPVVPRDQLQCPGAPRIWPIPLPDPSPQRVHGHFTPPSSPDLMERPLSVSSSSPSTARQQQSMSRPSHARTSSQHQRHQHQQPYGPVAVLPSPGYAPAAFAHPARTRSLRPYPAGPVRQARNDARVYPSPHTPSPAQAFADEEVAYHHAPLFVDEPSSSSAAFGYAGGGVPSSPVAPPTANELWLRRSSTSSLPAPPSHVSLRDAPSPSHRRRVRWSRAGDEYEDDEETDADEESEAIAHRLGLKRPRPSLHDR